MPVTYDSFSGTYRMGCTDCDTAVEVFSSTPGRGDRGVNGTLISETFRFHPGDGRFLRQCRTCANARAARNRAARAAAGGGTVRRATANATTRVRQALGLARKFGVEMELIFPSNVGRDRLNGALAAAGVGSWRCKTDGSLSAGAGKVGWEVVSPILRGQDGIDQIEKVCRVVQELGATINRSCGLHVHHDVADADVTDLKNVGTGWVNNQSLIDGLVSASRREGGSYYCRPLTGSDMAVINRARTLEEMQHVRVDRYRTLNFKAYGRFGTLEVRQHQGTMNFEKIRTWIMLGKAIIDTAIVDGNAMPRHSRMREFLNGMGDRLDETAKTFLLGRTVEFAHAAI